MAMFTDSVAIVTGAGQGIGEATAKLLAERGATVAVLDVNGEGAQRVVKEIEAEGNQAFPLEVDISQRDQVEASFEQIAKDAGSIDILVNNAAIVRDNLVHKMTDDDFDQVMNVNLKGSWLCAQVAQRYMVPQRSGNIVNLSSRAALGNRGQTNYSSAKAGVQGLTRTLAIELGQFGIRVNAIAPGHIRTDMTEGAAKRRGLSYEERKQEVLEKNAIKRVGEPIDIAYAVAFLASPEAGYITGQILYVTGQPNI